MKVYGGVIHIFLDLALVQGEWSASHLGPGERPSGTHWIGDWVGPRASLDVDKRKLRPLSRPAHC
jgi:hypothetical protein